MENFISETIGVLSWQWIVLIMLVFLWARHNWLALNNPGPARNRRLKWIIGNSFNKLYCDFLDKLLSFSIKIIGDNKHWGFSAKSSGTIYKIFGCNPFSAQSYEFCLKLALLYPIYIFVIIWGFNDISTIWNIEIFPNISNLDPFWKFLAFIFLIFPIFGFYILHKHITPPLLMSKFRFWLYINPSSV